MSLLDGNFNSLFQSITVISRVAYLLVKCTKKCLVHLSSGDNISHVGNKIPDCFVFCKMTNLSIVKGVYWIVLYLGDELIIADSDERVEDDAWNRKYVDLRGKVL